MSIKVLRTKEMLHPLLRGVVDRIYKEVIQAHSMPFALFETGRTHDRHQTLISKGRTRTALCRHTFNLTLTPPLYATAVDFVYFDGKWSWNVRDNTIKSWYILFGHLVLDACPELEWKGIDRKNTNYTHFELRRDIIVHNLDTINCVIP